ncbi:glycosyltransferase involved in cell wall biosynthesis [Salinibacter ruber]|uniref:glycosyltransferase n=1 Tax=Salinibacter ruber TaxID=146919 RepID=UPI0021678BDB|nr:glycosyltransferase [Salinibacter ruber]MCS4177383.1 glycosyltransferase involved in cell wall biosynthesis [Salinibacter ruber]
MGVISQGIAVFGPQYGVGGAGRVCSDIGKALGRKGYEVDFLVDGNYSGDNYLEEGLPSSCRLVKLTDAQHNGAKYNPHYYYSLLKSLVQYLSAQQTGILISNITKFNVLSVWAKLLSGSTFSLVLVEHNLLSHRITGRSPFLTYLVRSHYPYADSVVTVSSDIKKDLCENHGVSRDRCTTIQNPLNIDSIRSKSGEEVDHGWLRSEAPVVLGVGRFVEQKQFSVLLEAFALLTRQLEVRLVLAGDGPLREELQELTSELGIEEQVDFLGFVSNPYKYMQKADLLAISSHYEGFGVVATEALACGTPVASTDCPGGPSDILEEGKYGELVDVGDARGLADAMHRVLNDPPKSERLVERAKSYRVDKVADRYDEVIQRVGGGYGTRAPASSR